MTSNNNTLDFRAIAQELVDTSQNTINDDRALVPAEATARQQRESNRFMRRPSFLGSTVDQEGLTNNYAVEPNLYYANFPSPYQARNYLVQGVVASLFVISTIVTAFVVS